MPESDSSDIIEVGEDGTFEIPETVTKKFLHAEKLKTSEAHEEVIGKTANENNSTGHDHSILKSLSAGEYKVLRDPSSGKVNAILCLHNKEVSKSIRISQNAISVDLEGNNHIYIPLPSPVDTASATSKSYKNYITIQVNSL
jgi:hypothetical protein